MKRFPLISALLIVCAYMAPLHSDETDTTTLADWIGGTHATYWGLGDSVRNEPMDWGNDYIAEEFPDHELSSERSAGMDAILKYVIKRQINTAPKWGTSSSQDQCKHAAYVTAFNFLISFEKNETVAGFLNSLIDLEAQLISGGANIVNLGLVDAVKHARKGALEDALIELVDDLRSYLQDTPVEIYRWYSSDFEQCTPAMIIIWDKANEWYQVMISGDCNCERTSYKKLTERVGGQNSATKPLAEWMVFVQGTITPEAIRKNGKVLLKYDVKGENIRLEDISANCRCDAYDSSGAYDSSAASKILINLPGASPLGLNHSDLEMCQRSEKMSDNRIVSKSYGTEKNISNKCDLCDTIATNYSEVQATEMKQLQMQDEAVRNKSKSRYEKPINEKMESKNPEIYSITDTLQEIRYQYLDCTQNLLKANDINEAIEYLEETTETPQMESKDDIDYRKTITETNEILEDHEAAPEVIKETEVQDFKR